MNSPLPIGVTYDTPYALVKEHFVLPFELYKYQADTVNELAPLQNCASYAQPGLGKSAVSTVCALFKRCVGEIRQTLVIMPPILDGTWRRWLAQVKHADGTQISVLSYRGTPKERAAMKLDTDFILVGNQIFKKDFDRLSAWANSTHVHVILDEANSIGRVSSDMHKKYREFVLGRSHMMLSGTPISNVENGYAHCRLKSPTIYRNLASYLRIHAKSVDFFGKVDEWQNLDLLEENMRVNAVFTKKEDVLLDLPPKIVSHIHYDLDPQHLKLYQRLVDEQLLALPDNTKIDATTASGLWHALQQIVLSWNYFSGDESKVAAGFDLIEEVLDEIGNEKLVVFASYRRSNAAIIERFKEKYGAVGVYGDVPAKEKERNLARFISDPRCRLITLQPISAGYGIDGLQHVASDVLFIEQPLVAAHYEQALARLYRDGQRKSVNVRLAVANKTIQVKLLQKLIDNEDLVAPLNGSKAELRKQLLGG